MSIQIKNTWPPTLCQTCKSSGFLRSDTGETRVYCQSYERVVNARIVECTSYFNKNYAYEHELNRMAWLSDPNEKRHIGFVPPGSKDWQKIRDGSRD